MAIALQWIPDSLYNYSLAAVVSNHSAFKKEIPALHNDVLFDVCYKMYKEGLLKELQDIVSDVKLFCRLLLVKDSECRLHHCFEALIDHSTRIADELSVSYNCDLSKLPEDAMWEVKNDTITMGMLLGNFLNDGGWYQYSGSILSNCFLLCRTIKDKQYRLQVSLDCLHWLLYAKNEFSMFYDAEQLFHTAVEYIDEMHEMGKVYNCAGLYKEFSNFFFIRNQYSEAYEWSINALKEIKTCNSPKVIASVLRHAAKVCVMKRKFKKAEFLIKQAFLITNMYFGNRGLEMSCFLSDYGFYLLNIDSLNHACVVYQAALQARQYTSGGRNLLLALAHEDLAYALYIREYNEGRFKHAKEHAEKGLQILTNLLPSNHFFLSTSKRIKALIVEEIAIDSFDKTTEKRLLLESLELHTSALRLTREICGENNVYTAKHYGNLGRLYQSMKRFEDAKQMHFKAIKIKEQLLGPDEYEVALSVGHLASLYNYNLMEFEEAEVLYKRSIAISKRIFGNAFSGLEFDYLGLIRIYTAQGNTTCARHCHDALSHWRVLREKIIEAEDENSPLSIDINPVDLKEIYSEFLEIH